MKTVGLASTFLFSCTMLQAASITLGYLEYAPQFDVNDNPIYFQLNLAVFDRSIDDAFGFLAQNASPLQFAGINLFIETVDKNVTHNTTSTNSFTHTDAIARIAPSIYTVPLETTESWLSRTVQFPDGAGGFYTEDFTRQVIKITMTTQTLPGATWRIFDGTSFVYFIPTSYNLTQAFNFTYGPAPTIPDFSRGAQFATAISGLTFVPEPSTIILTGLGFTLLGFKRRSRKN